MNIALTIMLVGGVILVLFIAYRLAMASEVLADKPFTDALAGLGKTPAATGRGGTTPMSEAELLAAVASVT